MKTTKAGTTVRMDRLRKQRAELDALCVPRLIKAAEPKPRLRPDKRRFDLMPVRENGKLNGRADEHFENFGAIYKGPGSLFGVMHTTNPLKSQKGRRKRLPRGPQRWAA